MRIALLCATRRGLRVLDRVSALVPDATLDVFSFREEAWEPPFLDDIRALTESRGGTFHEARQVGAARWATFWETTPIDLMLAVSWRYMIPASVYRRMRRGAYVFHDSLLPEYRGFAPTVWAIVNGEDHTGVTLFEIADAVDAGDIVDQRRVPIGPDDEIGEVMERVTEGYLALVEDNLPRLLDATAPRCPQDHTRATYLSRRLPEDACIDWSAPTGRVYDLIRASTDPYPGAFTTLGGARLRVWRAKRLAPEPRYVGRVPGRVVEVRPGEGSVVLTGDGALLLTEVQREGERRAAAASVLDSLSLTLGR